MANFDPHEFARPPIVLTGADRARLAALADRATQDNPDVARFCTRSLRGPTPFPKAPRAR